MILFRKLGTEFFFGQKLRKGHSEYLVSPFQRLHYLGPIFLKPSFFIHFFTVSLLIPSWFPILLRECSGSCWTSWRTSSRSTVSGLIFFGVKTYFSWKFLCHFLIFLPSGGRLLRSYFALYSHWTFGGFWFRRTKEQSLLTPSEYIFVDFLSLLVAFLCFKINGFLHMKSVAGIGRPMETTNPKYLGTF